jgi:hypothetical protein
MKVSGDQKGLAGTDKECYTYKLRVANITSKSNRQNNPKRNNNSTAPPPFIIPRSKVKSSRMPTSPSFDAPDSSVHLAASPALRLLQPSVQFV